MAQPAVQNLEMKPADVDKLLNRLIRENKKFTNQGKTAAVRLRVTRDTVILEAIAYVSGKPQVKKTVQIPAKRSSPPYSELRSQFEAAAAMYRVKPPVLAGHRKRNAASMAEYWKQTPAE